MRESLGRIRSRDGKGERLKRPEMPVEAAGDQVENLPRRLVELEA